MCIYTGDLIQTIPLKNKLKLKQLKHASRFVTHNSLLTIHYSLFPTRPSSAQSSSLATPLAYFATLKSLSTFMGLRFGR